MKSESFPDSFNPFLREMFVDHARYCQGGTFPTFFKIPITQTLSTHIRDGTYPPEETCVTYYSPPVPRPGCRYSEGMRPLDNRHVITKCYDAFKAFVAVDLD
jgi:hypothetical protein